MALANRFIPHAINLNTAGGTSAWLNQIESATPQGGITLFEETTGSETDRQFVAEKDIMPTIPISMSDLTALATVGFSGVFISPGSGTPGATLYGRLLPLGALPGPIATTEHLQLLVSDGLLVPDSVRASHNTVARLSLTLHATLGSSGSSGATPFVYTINQAIASGAGVTSNIYTAGPVKFTISGGASSLVAGIVDEQISFGIGVNKEGTDGEVYPSHISILSRAPRFEFTTKDPTLLATVGDGVSVSAFAMYFRQVNSEAQRVAASSTTHIKVSATAGMVTPGSLNLTHKKTGDAAFTFTPANNSGLITISTTSSIPTS